MDYFFPTGIFDELYTVIFPFLGNFFGFLSRVSSSSILNFIEWFFGLNGSLAEFVYWNLFTGETLTLASPLYSNIFAKPIGQGFLVILRQWGIANTMPTWCALILVSVNVGIIFRCLKTLIPSV